MSNTSPGDMCPTGLDGPAGSAGSAVAKNAAIKWALALAGPTTGTGSGLTDLTAGSSDQKTGEVSGGLHGMPDGSTDPVPGALTHPRPLAGRDRPKCTQETGTERESHPPKRQATMPQESAGKYLDNRLSPINYPQG